MSIDVSQCRGLQPWPEKSKACANEPKPPRVTPLVPPSDELAEVEWADESPLKKLDLDDHRPPLPPLDEPLLVQGVLGCACAATPGEAGSQLMPGISV